MLGTYYPAGRYYTQKKPVKAILCQRYQLAIKGVLRYGKQPAVLPAPPFVMGRGRYFVNRLSFKCAVEIRCFCLKLCAAGINHFVYPAYACGLAFFVHLFASNIVV